MESATHLAGPVVVINGRIIQRCAVCGEKLRDNLGEQAPMKPDGSPPEFHAWEEAALVQVAGNRASRIGSLNDDLPDDFCLALVE